MVDGTAKADSDPNGVVGLEEGREVVGQFSTNAFTARGSIHLESAPFEETSVLCSSDQLEFGAPDLDPERGHKCGGWRGPVGRVDRVLASVTRDSVEWEDRRRRLWVRPEIGRRSWFFGEFGIDPNHKGPRPLHEGWIGTSLFELAHQCTEWCHAICLEVGVGQV